MSQQLQPSVRQGMAALEQSETVSKERTASEKVASPTWYALLPGSGELMIPSKDFKQGAQHLLDKVKEVFGEDKSDIRDLYDIYKEVPRKDFTTIAENKDFLVLGDKSSPGVEIWRKVDDMYVRETVKDYHRQKDVSLAPFNNDLLGLAKEMYPESFGLKDNDRQYKAVMGKESSQDQSLDAIAKDKLLSSISNEPWFRTLIDAGFVVVDVQPSEELVQRKQPSNKTYDGLSLYSQYNSVKEKHPNHIVLMRCGDFYESYGNDAKELSKVLGITYTEDKKHGYGIAGFPHHALDEYLPKLIHTEHKVAICEGLPREQQQKVDDKKQNQQGQTAQLDNQNSSTMSRTKKPQVKQVEASEAKTEGLSKEKTANETIRTTKEQRESFKEAVAAVAGKNVHNPLEVKFTTPFTVTNAKGNGEVLASMQVLRGRVTFTTDKGDKLQILALSSSALDRLQKADVLEQVKRARERKAVHEKVEVKNKVVRATKEQQDQFTKDIKSLMGTAKYVPLPNFGTKEGVVASLANRGVSISGVHQWEDNISFTTTIPGEDSKNMLYLHPKDIRPEFYDLLKTEVGKAMQPQLITENGQKVTGAIVFPAKDNPNKILFYAKLDGQWLHPKVISNDDYIRFTDEYAKDRMTVKDLFEKYYPTKMAKKLDKEQFNDMRISDGQELTKFRVYKQDKPENEHYKEYMMYAETGNRRLHAVPMSHDLLDAYFDRTMSKGQLAEKVLGEQLHLKSAYERYVLPEEVASTKLYKPNGSKEYVVTATLKDGRQTPERPINGNDLYSYFRAKTATQQQIAAKYLMDDIKAVAKRPLQQQVERHQGLKR